MPTSLVVGLHEREAAEMQRAVEGIRCRLPDDLGTLSESDPATHGTELVRDLIDHCLGLPERMRRLAESSLARARAGAVTDLAETGEAVSSLIAYFAQTVHSFADVVNAFTRGGVRLEGVGLLPAVEADLNRTAEVLIESWPWPEGWWPAVNREMLAQSYAADSFLSKAEVYREVLGHDAPAGEGGPPRP